MNIKDILKKIASGSSVNDAINMALSEGEGYSSDFWRMIIEDLMRAVKKGVRLRDAIDKAAKSWSVAPQEITDFLRDHNLMSKARNGTLTDTDVLRLTAKMSGSEEEFDAYVEKGEKPKSPLPKRKLGTGAFRRPKKKPKGSSSRFKRDDLNGTS